MRILTKQFLTVYSQDIHYENNISRPPSQSPLYIIIRIDPVYIRNMQCIFVLLLKITCLHLHIIVLHIKMAGKLIT